MCDSLCNKCYFSLAAARLLFPHDGSPLKFFCFDKEFNSTLRVLPLQEDSIYFGLIQ